MTYDDDPLIGSFSHDVSRPRSGDALLRLRKIASLVKPIMRARGMRVGILAEFYPKEQNLLGLNQNRGQKIFLRLRYASDDSLFLPDDQVIDTCLHELAHNVFGPHDGKFHALWDQLRDEYEALVRKGYTGEGFLGQGKRLGGRIGASPTVTMEETRRQVRAAAARRQQNAALSAGSGQRLGGRVPGPARDIREVIAGAADRRKAITQGCGANITSESGRRAAEAEASDSASNGFQTKAEEDEANERAIMQAYMELVQEEERERFGDSYVPVSQENPLGSRAGNMLVSGTKQGAILPAGPPPVPLATKPGSMAASSSRDAGFRDEPSSSTSPAGWSCEVCTFFNQPNHLCCDVCTAERPSSTLTADDLAGIPDDFGTGASSGRHKRPSSSATGASRNKAPRADLGKLKPRTDRETVEKIFAAAEAQKEKPVGWLCSCGNFMEYQWWTCAKCGAMKATS